MGTVTHDTVSPNPFNVTSQISMQQMTSFNPFTITGGTGSYNNLRGGGQTAGIGPFGDPNFETGTSGITWVGTASIVPEPSSMALSAAGSARVGQ